VIIGKQNIQFLWELVRLTTIVGVWLIVNGFSLSAESAIAMHAVAVFAMNALFVLAADRALRQTMLSKSYHREFP